jgi:hypothetical protein
MIGEAGPEPMRFEGVGTRKTASAAILMPAGVMSNVRHPDGSAPLPLSYRPVIIPVAGGTRDELDPLAPSVKHGFAEKTEAGPDHIPCGAGNGHGFA